jgi:DNA repair and recombination protein RAD52
MNTPSKPGPAQNSNQLNNCGRNGLAVQQVASISSPTKQPPRQPVQRAYPPPISAPLRPQSGMSSTTQQGQPPQGQQARPMQRPQGPQPQLGPSAPHRSGQNMQPPASRPQANATKPSPPHHQPQNSTTQQTPTSAPPRPPQPQGQTTTPANVPHNPPTTFFSGRAAMNLKGENDTIPEQASAFNPHRPTTIPRSAGIDHTKSSPIPRKVIQGQSGAGAFSPSNFQNPSMAMNRQIGVPPGRGTGGFRVPGLAGTKRGLDSHPTPTGLVDLIHINNHGPVLICRRNARAALSTSSGTPLNPQAGAMGGTGGNDAKRARN